MLEKTWQQKQVDSQIESSQLGFSSRLLPGIPAHRMVLPVSNVGFPPQLHLSRNILTDTPEVCHLCSSKPCQTNHHSRNPRRLWSQSISTGTASIAVVVQSSIDPVMNMNIHIIVAFHSVISTTLESRAAYSRVFPTHCWIPIGSRALGSVYILHSIS